MKKEVFIIPFLLLSYSIMLQSMGSSDTELHKAVRKSDFFRVQSLLKQGADPNVQDDASYNRTPLHDAVEKNSFEDVLLLLKHGADPNIQNSNGETALIKSIMELVKKNALLQQDNNHSTMYACRMQRIDQLKKYISVLVYYGADPTYAINGKNAINLAQQHGLNDVVQWLQNPFTRVTFLLTRLLYLEDENKNEKRLQLPKEIARLITFYLSGFPTKSSNQMNNNNNGKGLNDEN